MPKKKSQSSSVCHNNTLMVSIIYSLNSVHIALKIRIRLDHPTYIVRQTLNTFLVLYLSSLHSANMIENSRRRGVVRGDCFILLMMGMPPRLLKNMQDWRISMTWYLNCINYSVDRVGSLCVNVEE